MAQALYMIFKSIKIWYIKEDAYVGFFLPVFIWNLMFVGLSHSLLLCFNILHLALLKLSKHIFLFMTF